MSYIKSNFLLTTKTAEKLYCNYAKNMPIITGSKSNKEKFIIYCSVPGTAFGNPLYPRHHYFRRILSSYLGEMMENGLMTTDEALVSEVVKNICFDNSCKYFGLVSE